MRRAISVLALVCLCACTPAGSDDNPRDRKGNAGALTWRSVSQTDGQAAFLSRPGAAPDIVIWCRMGSRPKLRAHIFEHPSPQPNMTMTSRAGTFSFVEVRRQGGVRKGDRTLVEGDIAIDDTKALAVLKAANQFVLQSGDETYDVKDTDPDNILSGVIEKCAPQASTKPTTPVTKPK
jgi:hypothetical protein